MECSRIRKTSPKQRKNIRGPCFHRALTSFNIFPQCLACVYNKKARYTLWPKAQSSVLILYIWLSSWLDLTSYLRFPDQQLSVSVLKQRDVVLNCLSFYWKKGNKRYILYQNRPSHCLVVINLLFILNTGVFVCVIMDPPVVSGPRIGKACLSFLPWSQGKDDTRVSWKATNMDQQFTFMSPRVLHEFYSPVVVVVS